MEPNNTTSLPIYDSVRTIRAPMVKTDIDGEANKIVISIVNKRNAVLTGITIPLQSNIDMEFVLDSIEEEAKRLNVRRVQWRKRDIMFGFVKIEDLKNTYLEKQRKLKIVLTEPITRVNDPLERERVMAEAHINAETNEHYSRTVTTHRLQSRFIWKQMTLQANLFVKACNECNECNAKKTLPNSSEQ